MESKLGDILCCEEQLRSSLHCHDKSKLRTKLALLQKEYIKTVQKLQRAERLESVRKHVRSRITKRSLQDQVAPEETADPSPKSPLQTVDTTNGVHQCQENTGDPVDTNNSKKNQVVQNLLPAEAACPSSPDSEHDAAKSHRSSPGLRLRSRRSLLHWEKKSAEEKSRDNSETMEGRAEGEEAEQLLCFGNEKEDQCCSSESPSLLLSHWNPRRSTERKEKEGKVMHEGELKGESETGVFGEQSRATCTSSTGSAACTEDGAEHFLQRGPKKEMEDKYTEGQEDGRLSVKNKHKDTKQHAGEKTERGQMHQSTLEIQEKNQMRNDVKGVSLLDSCTLVEGLLFPVEYYVRTTRRMSSSQSQPDMQAVILSQLSNGRHRRNRGRDRASNRSALNNQRSTQDVSALTNTSTDAHVATQVVETASPNSDCIPASHAEAFSPVSVCSTRPGRGRRRGRGRLQTPRCSLRSNPLQLNLEQPPDEPQQPTGTTVSSSLSPHGAEPRPASEKAVPDSEDPQLTSTSSTATQPSPRVNGAQCSPAASPHLGKVYPIFLKSGNQSNRSSQITTSGDSLQSLLLPTPTQTSVFPLPTLSPGHLMSFDIQQDFHLPDDQFAALKLRKLRQVPVESALEPFTSPCCRTSSSRRRADTYQNSGEPVKALSLPQTLSTMVESSSVGRPNMTVEHKLSDNLMSSSLAEESSDATEAAENMNTKHSSGTSLMESVSVVEDSALDHLDKNKDGIPETWMTNSQTSVSSSRATRCVNLPDNTQLAPDTLTATMGRFSGELSEPDAELRTDGSDMDRPLDGPTYRQENETVITTPPPPQQQQQQFSEDPSHCCTALQTESTDELLLASELQGSAGSTGGLKENHLAPCSVHNQLLLSPQPFMASSAPPSSPTLPSLGPTPHLVLTALPLTSSLSQPASLHSPSFQTPAPPPPAPVSPCGPIEASSEIPSAGGQFQRVEPSLKTNEQRAVEEVEARVEEEFANYTHTIKAPAGCRLVDACCLLTSTGGLCVAAAGKWAVCLWSLVSASDWTLTHTWTFDEPVISVLPVPDAAGLMCVTLGQLEIREVRMLSCSSLSQELLCDSVIQTLVGVPKSRVVTSSHSVLGSTLQVFTLADSSRRSSHPLVSPGVCVGALAPVDGLSDALIGTDGGGQLFVWNLQTGKLLRRIDLCDGLAHTACLRGFSYRGVLFVLMQHQFLSSLEEVGNQTKAEGQRREKEVERLAMFSWVTVNPLSGKSVLATQLCPPSAWSGSLCDADVNSSSVVGVSHTGCLCVWELSLRGSSRMVWAPENEGWQLARWGAGDTLMTGLHNGDVILHFHKSGFIPQQREQR